MFSENSPFSLQTVCSGSLKGKHSTLNPESLTSRFVLCNYNFSLPGKMLTGKRVKKKIQTHF